jgi:hypothetical protein
MAYLYRHIRLDNFQPFYIGVGGLNKSDSYKRAFSTKNRNIRWKRIAEISKYKVEIILDNLTIDEAFKKEKEFIALYGKKLLCNMTNGGDGIVGYTFTKKDKLKIGLKSLGRILPRKTQEFKDKMSKFNKDNNLGGNNKRKIQQLTKDNVYIKTWNSILEAAQTLKISQGGIGSVCSLTRREKSYKGYIWKYE